MQTPTSSASSWLASSVLSSFGDARSAGRVKDDDELAVVDGWHTEIGPSVTQCLKFKEIRVRGRLTLGDVWLEPSGGMACDVELEDTEDGVAVGAEFDIDG